MRLRLLVGFLLAAAGTAAWLPAVPAGGAPAPVLPAWSIEGAYVLDIPVGFASLAGVYDFELDGREGTLNLNYDEKARLSGGGLVDVTFYSATAVSTVDAEGAQHVFVTDAPRNPGFTFDGVVQANGIDVVGTATHVDGFAGMAGAYEGPMTLRRDHPAQAYRTFILRLAARMDRRGRVRGELDEEGAETRARLDVFGGRILTDGRIRGRVRTSRVDGTTKATLSVRGRGWRVVLKGPVDADGFHALALIRAAGFAIDGAPIDLAVQPGPEPPPPPPPPPPPNMIQRCVARIEGSNVTITRQNAPRKFFGLGADVTCDFPLSILSAEAETLVADPTTAAGPNPVRFIVKSGGRTYLASAPDASVTLKVPRDQGGALKFSTSPGGTMELVCTGVVRDGTGRSKTVDVILQATVAQ